MKINIEGTEYKLDVRAAINGGVLTKVPQYPLTSGDVYVSGSASHILLVSAFFTDKDFILLGCGGLHSYSNSEYGKTMTREEVTAHLTKRGYCFSHNINGDVIKAINR